MPTYEYACNRCDTTFERFQRITAEPGGTCPSCGETDVRRLISGGTFHLKGGGWYADLYSSTGGKAAGAASGEGSAASASSADGNASSSADGNGSSSASSPKPAPSPSTSGGEAASS
jgi:putative FmdB family regulatory protein